MRQVEQKPAVAGAVGTVLVWILIFLFFYLGAVLFAPKPFKTIKIRLDSPTKSEKTVKKIEKESAKTQKSETKKTEQTQKTEKGDGSSTALTETRSNPVSQDLSASPSLPTPSPQSAQAKQDVEKTESKPASKKSEPKKAEPKKAESKPKAKAEPKKAAETAKQNPKPTKKAPVKEVEKPKMVEPQLQKSMDELLAEQQKPKKSAKKEFDWSQFDEMEGNTSSNSNAVAKASTSPASNQSAFSGSAAAASDSKSSAASAKSSSAKASSNQKASASTASALASAVSAHKYSSSGNGVSSSVTANTGASSDGKVALEMADGTQRILLEPAEPKIILSKEAAALIDSTKRLTVSFTVSASGRVSVSSVKISPDVLPSLVSMEIKDQLSTWRFASAPYSGTAKFDYTIQKQ